MALAAVWILFHAACAMHNGVSSSDGAGMGSSLPARFTCMSIFPACSSSLLSSAQKTKPGKNQ
jgi:hypothetical protein